MKKITIALLSILALSCQNDFDDETIQSLLTGTNQNIENVESISKEDTLYNYLTLISKDLDEEATKLGCIEFIYPFILFRFDDTDNYINQVSVQGNENFATLLNDLEEGYSIGLSYPISGNLLDGTPVIVESNVQLQESLETCIEEELEIIIGNCNDIITECIWKITESDNEETPYINAFFTIKDDGSIIFSVLEEKDTAVEEGVEGETIDDPVYNTYIGTWIFYYIGPDLHLNINFGPILENKEDLEEIDEDGETIKLDWNFDWKINYIDSYKIEIEKEVTQTSNEDDEIELLFNEIITLEKECESDSLENDDEN